MSLKKKTSLDNMNYLCILRKTIYVKTAISHLRLYGIVRKQLMRRIGYYFVSTVSVISNLLMVGSSNLNCKTLNLLDVPDQDYLK